MDAFKQLANRLDALPHGYPSTENGTELELLAYLFADLVWIGPYDLPGTPLRFICFRTPAGRQLARSFRSVHIRIHHLAEAR